MRTSDIWGMFKQYFLFALVGVVVIAAIFALAYFFVYKRLLKGKRRLSIGRSVLWIMFIGYMLMVMGATYLTRETFPDGYFRLLHLDLFSSYVSAWNSASLRAWQLIVLNILMLVPFGIFLPLLAKPFRNPLLAVGSGFLFTLIIEGLQYVSNAGIFEADDLFNNTLGALLGYCLVMIVLMLKEKPKRLGLKVICLSLPILLTIGCFAGVALVYQNQEYGNMSLAASTKMNCKNAEIRCNITLEDEPKTAMVYQTISYDKESGREKAAQLLKGFGHDFTDLSVVQYNDNALYNMVSQTDEGNLWLQYNGGTYSYTDFSLFDAEKRQKTMEEAEVRALLAEKNVFVPAHSQYSWKDDRFGFEVELTEENGSYYLGAVNGNVTEDGQLCDLSYNLYEMEAYKEEAILSPKEALEEIKQGRFESYQWQNAEIETIEVKKMELQHYKDSKGFLQPTYKITCQINGQATELVIPAMK